MKLHELHEGHADAKQVIARPNGDGFYDLTKLKITSLTNVIDLPKTIPGRLDVSYNRLKNLMGAPVSVGKRFECSFNPITSFEGIPVSIGDGLLFAHCKLTSLHNIHKHLKYCGEMAMFTGNPIKSHMLGLLLIEGLDMIYFDHKVAHIINKHLIGDRDVLACQEEMLAAGLDEFAQL